MALDVVRGASAGIDVVLLCDAIRGQGRRPRRRVVPLRRIVPHLPAATDPGRMAGRSIVVRARCGGSPRRRRAGALARALRRARGAASATRTLAIVGAPLGTPDPLYSARTLLGPDHRTFAALPRAERSRSPYLGGAVRARILTSAPLAPPSMNFLSRWRHRRVT